VVEFGSKVRRSETVLTVYEGCKYLWPVVAMATGHFMVTIDSSDWPEYKQSTDFLLKELQQKTLRNTVTLRMEAARYCYTFEQTSRTASCMSEKSIILAPPGV
jgi:hypothetical protein